jgi:hypothetical protein
MVIRYDCLMVKTVAEVGALLTVPLLKLSKITCGAAACAIPEPRVSRLSENAATTGSGYVLGRFHGRRCMPLPKSFMFRLSFPVH